MNQQEPPSVWPGLRFRDAQAGLRFLVDVCGFTEAAVHTDGDDVIAHAELRWPHGSGGVMFGTARTGDPFEHTVGAGTVYVVCSAGADVDAVHERVRAAADQYPGVKVLDGPVNRDYGSYEVAIMDPEGNTWSFGTYPGT